jgi:phage shock protein A
MSESVFVRIKRIISANIQDSIDRMERAGGAATMREAIREVEQVVEEAKLARNHATARRLQAVRQQGLYRERLTMLQQKAEFAMAQSREDLAEAALLRQLEFEEQIETLARTEVEAAAEEKRLEESLASLLLRKAQMEEELSAFEAARQDAGVNDQSGISDGRQGPEARVERAEAAFQRAMRGAGINAGMVTTAARTAASLGELDQLMKNATISERMAVLREKRQAS